MSDVRDRAEQMWLTAESLERQLTHAQASEAVLLAVSDAVDAARELYQLVRPDESETP